MKPFFLLFSLLCSAYCSSQIQFEKGYFIDNSGNKVEALIRNKEWLVNPSEFTYKLNESSPTQTATSNAIQEFGIGDNIKYVRRKVEIDVSPTKLRDLNNYPEPKTETETVLLQVLLEGDVNLYKFQKGGRESYYVEEGNKNPELLVMKKYLADGRIATNYKYRQQLYSGFNCGNTAATEYSLLEYRQKVLTDYFQDYHTCKNLNYRIYNNREKGGRLNIGIKGGVDLSTLEIQSGYNATGTKESLSPSLRIGAEAEYVLPFNRNKWATFLEATYRTSSFEKEYETTFPAAFTQANLIMNFKYVSFTGGVRHYLFLNDNSKLFINVGAVIDTPLFTQILFERDERYELDPELKKVKTGAYFTAGAGYNFNNRISAELRYESSKEVTGRNIVETHYDLNWKSSTSTLSFILGYRFL